MCSGYIHRITSLLVSVTNNNYFSLSLLLIIFYLANKFINQTILFMSLSLFLSFFLRYIIFIHPFSYIIDQKRLFSGGSHFQHLDFPHGRGFFRSVAARSAPLIKPSKESVAFQARTFQLNGRNYGVCVIKAAVSFPADRRIGLPNSA